MTGVQTCAPISYAANYGEIRKVAKFCLAALNCIWEDIEVGEIRNIICFYQNDFHELLFVTFGLHKIIQ